MGWYPLNSGARSDFAQFDTRRRRPRDLIGYILPLDAHLMTQSQDDRPDHRREQDEAGGLEEEEILRIEHAPERGGVGDSARWRGGCRGGRRARPLHGGVTEFACD